MAVKLAPAHVAVEPARMLRAAALLIPLVLAGAAQAQQAHTADRSMGGRGAESEVRTAAQRAANDLGLSCVVTDAVALGRDGVGRPAWEIACEVGDGHVVIAGDRTMDCLALANGSTPCRLPANRNAARAVAGLAREAGVTCRVAEGRLVGRTSDEARIYEVGCADGAGVWIEQNGEAWTVTPCDRVAAIGGECRFTSQADVDRALIARVAAVCPARRARFMGGEANGEWYEAACDDGRRLVARIDASGAVAETLPCAEAGLIGDGCRLDD